MMFLIIYIYHKVEIYAANNVIYHVAVTNMGHNAQEQENMIHGFIMNQPPASCLSSVVLCMKRKSG